MAAYKWHPITDLPENPKTLTDGELESLRRVWIKQKEDLADPESLDEFNKRLRREWAIETGVIENVYTIDRGVTRTLIEKGIDAALIPHGTTDPGGTVVARIIQDHLATLEGLFDFVGGTRQLSTSYIKELHAALLRNQETYAVVDQFGRAFERRLEKGQYKTEPNSPTRPDGTVHEYCPPEHVAAEMDRLIAMHAEHEIRGVPAEVESTWLHHRFTQIHPFPDGNGRVARAISTLVFIKAGWFPLIIKRDDWSRYVEALENADRDDLGPLVLLFIEAQRSALVQTTEAAYEARPITSADEAIAAVGTRLRQAGKYPPNEWQAAIETANRLAEFARQRLQEIAGGLSKQTNALAGNFTFGSLNTLAVGERHVKLARDAGYLVDLPAYSRTVRLDLRASTSGSLVISFSALGARYHGIIAAVASIDLQGSEPYMLQGGTLLINYEEKYDSAQRRFAAWLEKMIVAGLNKWRATL